MITDFDQLDLSKTYSYADYLLWQFDERVELIKGKIFKMSPAPSTKHQTISFKISFKFGVYLEYTASKIFSAPFDVRLAVSEDIAISKKYKNKAKKLPDGKIMTVVQPDICVICDDSKLDERGCVGAPDLVVEILSPGNTQREMKDKFEIYQEAGVLEYWLVEPNDEFVIVYQLDKGIYIGSKPFTRDETVISKVLKGLTVAVNDIFN